MYLFLNRLNAHTPEQLKRKRGGAERDAPAAAAAEGRPPKRPRSEKIDADPLQPQDEMLPRGDDDMAEAVREVYRDHWAAIRSHYTRGNYVQDRYNYRIQDLNLEHLQSDLDQMFRNQESRFKINASFGFILRNLETGQLRYYHSSQNVGRLLDAPHLISNQEE